MHEMFGQFELEEGRIVEYWIQQDAASFMAQLTAPGS